MSDFRIQARRIRRGIGFLLLWPVLWGMLPPADGCDPRLLALLQGETRIPPDSAWLLRFGQGLARLPEHLVVLDDARQEWNSLKGIWQERLVLPASGCQWVGDPESWGGIASQVADLDGRIAEGDLLRAHEVLQALYLAILQNLARRTFPEPQQSLLRGSIALWKLQEGARSRSSAGLGPVLALFAESVATLEGNATGTRHLGAVRLREGVERLARGLPASGTALPDAFLIQLSLCKELFNDFLVLPPATPIASPTLRRGGPHATIE